MIFYNDSDWLDSLSEDDIANGQAEWEEYDRYLYEMACIYGEPIYPFDTPIDENVLPF